MIEKDIFLNSSTVNVNKPGTPGLVLGIKRNERRYELTNHLGNVLSVISDVKRPKSESSNTYYDVDRIAVNDYYSFGMQMPGRKQNLDSYRYGFNGKENDNEVKGEGNQQDYGMRIYDPRVGRFLSVDPMAGKNTNISPYCGFANNPLLFVDPDGGDNVIYLIVLENNKKVINYQQVAKRANEFFKLIGVGTTVVLYTGSPESFDPKDGFDPTDAVAVLGSPQKVLNYIENNLKDLRTGEHSYLYYDPRWLKSNNYPESSKNSSPNQVDPTNNVIALAEDRIIGDQESSWANMTFSSNVDAIAFLILHGAGHNSSIQHTSGFMADGQDIISRINEGRGPYAPKDGSAVRNLADLFTNQKDRENIIPKIIEIMFKRFDPDKDKASSANIGRGKIENERDERN